MTCNDCKRRITRFSTGNQIKLSDWMVEIEAIKIALDSNNSTIDNDCHS